MKIRPWKVGGTGVQTYSKAQPSNCRRCWRRHLNGHGIAGLAAAVDYINSVGLDAIQAKERFLTRRFVTACRR